MINIFNIALNDHKIKLYLTPLILLSLCLTRQFTSILNLRDVSSAVTLWFSMMVGHVSSLFTETLLSKLKTPSN